MENDILDRANDIKTAMKTALYFKGDVARRLRSQGILRNAIVLIETLEAELETAKKERGYKVLIVPEGATELIPNGIIPNVNGVSNELFQDIIIQKQLKKEFLYKEKTTSGPWTVHSLPDELVPFQKEITEMVNENVPWGCCGGCI